MNLNGQSPSYGLCYECKQQRTAAAWCKICDIASLKENFRNWTSGNSKIDDFIRYTQLNANKPNDFLEWIDFDRFDLVEYTNKKGAFSSIYSAMWLEGPRWKLDDEAEIWTRSGPIKVILKRLNNSQNLSQEFIDQLYRYHKCLQHGALANCIGITKDPTSCYMFVMRYYKNGNLYSYLEESVGTLYWRDIVDMLWSISTGLESIHEYGLVHGNLHGGNILIERKMNSIDAKIADTGLHGPADKQTSSQQIYGVIPFVAPEVFKENIITKVSDIYSFGMIMWVLSAGVRPYSDKPHDNQLIQEICSGLRPNVINGTPLVYSNLMLQCLDVNPSNRPTVFQICEYIGNWISDLSSQFGDNAETKFANLEKLNLRIIPCHEKATYFSRPLDSIN
ncbi:kinase-like domain-containing protein [Glomus cerebriforme]|uniref:Kinase-like domain-containing protein n=1 Tax=Glomus cerebriforme TaxID=658196 RepID=A0A397SU89_9GLOM|nr:kinase-like domain-containing protein [Glomus cerebriforme]